MIARFHLANLSACESVSGGKDDRACHHSNLEASHASESSRQDISYRLQCFNQSRGSQRQSDGFRSAADSDGSGSVSGSGSMSSVAT